MLTLDHSELTKRFMSEIPNFDEYRAGLCASVFVDELAKTLVWARISVEEILKIAPQLAVIIKFTDGERTLSSGKNTFKSRVNTRTGEVLWYTRCKVSREGSVAKGWFGRAMSQLDGVCHNTDDERKEIYRIMIDVVNVARNPLKDTT